MSYIDNQLEFQEKYRQLNDYVKEILSEKRYRHTISVVAEGERLAKLNRLSDEDIRRVKLACVFHDSAKELPDEKMTQLIKKYNLPERYIGNSNLAHGKIASKTISDDFAIFDEDIVNGISYHTTGRAGMSDVEKIVFIADAIEPLRDYDVVDKIRKVTYEDLNLGCHLMLVETIKMLAGKNQGPIDSDTVESEQWFREIIKEKIQNMESKDMAMIAAKALDSKHAEDIMVIDIALKSSIADYMVIASAKNERMVGAQVDEVEDQLAKVSILPRSIEGKKDSGWMLMDYGDIIVNVLTEDMRGRYNIEKIWGDCEVLKLED